MIFLERACVYFCNIVYPVLLISHPIFYVNPSLSILNFGGIVRKEHVNGSF